MDHFKSFVLQLINRIEEFGDEQMYGSRLYQVSLSRRVQSLNGTHYGGFTSSWCNDFLKFLAAVDFSLLKRDSRLDKEGGVDRRDREGKTDRSSSACNDCKAEVPRIVLVVIPTERQTEPFVPGSDQSRVLSHSGASPKKAKLV